MARSSERLSISWLFRGGSQKSKRWNLCEKKGNKRISFETVTGGEEETKVHSSTQKRNSSTSLETSLKEAVESRRPSLDPPSDGDEDFFPEEQNWESEGSGIADEAEKLTDQLHLCLGSIKAGNSSIELKN